MVLPILFGAASFASGALQSIGQYQSQVADTNYANAQRRQQYQYDMQNYNYSNQMKAREYNQALQIRQQRTQQYQEQVAENNRGYGEYLFQNQAKFNETVRQAMGDKLDAQLALMKANAANSARGRQGKRSGLANAANLQAFGREQANRADDLASAEYFADYEAKEMQRKTAMDNKNAWYNSGVGIQMLRPTFGPAPMRPVMQSAPSQFGLYSGLLGAAGNAYSTYKGLTPPAA